MSKLIAYGALSAVTLTSASVGGYYLFNSGGHGEDTEPGSIAPTPLSFDSLASFKQSAGSNASGIKEYFEGLDLSKDGESVADGLTNAGSFFDGLKANEPGARGYLRIGYQKKTSSSWDWAGKLSWLWVFATQDRGMITFGAVETTNNREFNVQAILYLVKKEGDSWKIKHRKESGDKKIVQNEFDNKFPLPSDAFRSQNMIDENWDFVKPNDKSILIPAMCAWQGCSTTLAENAPILKILRWQTDAGSSNTTGPGSWFSNSGWCKHLFGEEAVKLMKLQTPKGIWTVDTSVS